MSVCSLRWFAEDMLLPAAKWVVRETADEVHSRFWKALERLDSRMQPSHVRRGWDGMLAEEAVERVRAEAQGVTECVEPPKRVDDKGRPAGYYTTLDTYYALVHYGFPSDPRDGDMYIAPDGGEWVWRANSDFWEAMTYPPGGDPYQAVKARERAESVEDTECVEPPVEHAFLPCGVIAPDRDSLLPYKCSLEDGHNGNHVAWAGKLPIAEWADGSRFVFEPGEVPPTDSPAAGAPVPPPEVADEGPSVVEHSPAPTEGHPNELVDLIDEVLHQHRDYLFDMERIHCVCGFDLPGDMRPNYGHREHIAQAIAEHLERAMKRVCAEHVLDNAVWLDRNPVTP